MELNVLADHFYIVLTLALLFGGIPALLTAIYLSLHGYVSMSLLFVLYIITSVIIDTAWYTAGFILKKYHPAWLKKYIESVHRVESMYVNHGIFKMIFISRFVYGTNSAVSVLAGLKTVNFKKFTVVCFSTLIMWFFVMFAIGSAIEASLPDFQGTIKNIIWGISIFWITAIIIFIGIKRYLHKKHFLR